MLPHMQGATISQEEFAEGLLKYAYFTRDKPKKCSLCSFLTYFTSPGLGLMSKAQRSREQMG